MASRWEVQEERCPCCATKRQRITWAIVGLFVVALIVIVVPLALVGLGPDVKFVSLTVSCPQKIGPGYTAEDCWNNAQGTTGGVGLLVQLIVEIQSNSYEDGDAKLRAVLLDPNQGKIALSEQGNMGKRIKVSGNGKALLGFTPSAEGEPYWVGDERMRLYKVTETLDFGAAQIYNPNSNTTTEYEVIISGTVSSKMGPFAHTNTFEWRYTFPGGENMPNVVDP